MTESFIINVIPVGAGRYRWQILRRFLHTRSALPVGSGTVHGREEAFDAIVGKLRQIVTSGGPVLSVVDPEDAS